VNNPAKNQPNSLITKIDDISPKEFTIFQSLIFEKAGITVADSKSVMVSSRLIKRLRHFDVSNFSDYIKIFQRPENQLERQMVVDLLTTNETYFFREPKHFDFLKSNIFPKLKPNPKIRVWSGASSSGEEPYTLAMLLDDQFGDAKWQLVASDISTRVLETANRGIYHLNARGEIPKQYLSRYCLKGTGEQEGCMLINDHLRKHISFKTINLNEKTPNIGKFDIIFLRNVLIYFNKETKQKVVENVIQHLQPGGYFFISHSETLNGICDSLKTVGPSIYMKP